jgi:diacylglycerol kinase family enzyme
MPIKNYSMSAKILYLYNPLSNQERTKKEWELFCKQYPTVKKSAYSLLEITDLTTFIKTHAPEILVIAGGDGSINSVCTAVLKLTKKPKLAILPFGSGNALSYCFGMETREKALEAILHPKHAVAIDVMKTSLSQKPFGMFNVGVGFDGRIIHDHANNRYIGFRSYALSAIKSIFFEPHSELTFTIDHTVTLSARASSLMVANGPLIGYNYLVAPNAKLNDGLLDCTLFSTRYAYLTNLRLRGFKHPLYTRIGKVHFKASHIKIQGEPYIQIDGDPVMQPQGIEISLMKAKLHFLYNPAGIATLPEPAFVV